MPLHLMAMNEAEIRQLVEDKYQAAEDGDLLALLGVSENADKAAIQKAFFELAKVLHPDKLSKYGVDDLKAKAVKAFKSLSEGYNLLLDPEKRAEYIASRTSPSQAAAEAVSKTNEELLEADAADLNVDQEEAAKIFSHKGALLLKKGDYAQAQDFYQKAVESDAENPRYAMYLGWTMFRNNSNSLDVRMEESKKHLENAVENDAENPDAHYFIAKWYKEAGKVDECKKHLQTAIKLRHNYIEAKRELRLLEMRSGKTTPPARESGKAPAKDKKGKKSSSDGAGWPFGLDRFFKKK